MKLFLDTADVDQIREAARWGVIDGVTTNPSHVLKTGRSPAELYPEICNLVDGPVSLETVALEAEQIVDSLFSATGTPFRLEEVSLDIDSVRTQNNSISLGKPRRAWMLASTSNERDRPSLSLPRITAVASRARVRARTGVTIQPPGPD